MPRNSVDSDQTAPLFAQSCLPENLGSLQYGKTSNSLNTKKYFPLKLTNRPNSANSNSKPFKISALSYNI